MKRIGIIGGMGPAATIDLFKKILNHTNASCDQDHIPLIIDNYPQIPDRTEFILDNKKADPYPFLKESALRLRNAGCEAIVLACNTAHFHAKQLEDECKINIIHIAKNGALALKNLFPNAKKIAIIGTTGTHIAKIYENEFEKYDYEIVPLLKKDMDFVMKIIYDGIKKGKINDFQNGFNELVSSINADVFIAACTEIPLLLPDCPLKDRFLDPTDELAKEIVRFSKS